MSDEDKTMILGGGEPTAGTAIQSTSLSTIADEGDTTDEGDPTNLHAIFDEISHLASEETVDRPAARRIVHLANRGAAMLGSPD